MTKVLKDESGKRIHSYIPELCEELRKGDIDRREFLRVATLLGVSAGSAYAMAGKITGQQSVIPQAAAETPKRGGTLRSSMEVQEITDPATFDWTQRSNIARGIVEYMVRTGADNITRPYLAEGWEASDDLKTWTFKLRKGIKWTNGDEFNADDVVYNFKRWTDPATGSSNIGLFDAMVEESADGKKKMIDGAVEKVDSHTVRLNLKSAVLSIPENLYNYPTAIVHRRFDEEGGDLAKNPVGTGPFRLAEYRVGEVAVLERRDGYWGKEPYLDRIRYIDHGDDPSAGVAALASGQVDHIYEVSVEQTDIIKRLPNAVLNQAVTAQTGVARMQVDQAPFDDIRVRKAVQACIDHDRILQLAYRGFGAPGEDHHVSPIHPEYAELPKQKQDHELAKKLLAEAGHGGGLKLKMDLKSSPAWELAAMQAFKEQLAPAGIDLALNVMPSAQYWEIWDKTPFGFTAWTHRPLGVMVLNLGYRSGVPWNESHYNSAEFDAALDDASGTLEVNERRKKMEKVEGILQGDAVISQPLWRSVFTATAKNVRGYKTHPTYYHQMQDVWLA